AWLLAVLHLFRLEEREVGNHAIFYGDYASAGQRIFSPQSVAQYARYSDGLSPARRPPRVYGAADIGSHARRELRHLWPCLRAVRKSRRAPWKRGISGFGKISGSRLGREHPRQPEAADRPCERHPPRKSCLAIRREPPLSQRG